MSRLQVTLQEFWDRHQRPIHTADFGITSNPSRAILLVDKTGEKLTHIQMKAPDDVIAEIAFADVKDVKFYPEVDEKVRTETPEVSQNNSLVIKAKNVVIVMVITHYDYSKLTRYYQYSPPTRKKRTPNPEVSKPETE